MKITVHKFSEKDIPDRVNWINDIRINRHMHFDLPASIINTENWFKAISVSHSRIDLVFKDESGRALAMAGFADINLHHQHAEFYIFINPDEQGKGYGRLVTKWMMNYGFLKYGLNKIYLYTDTDNNGAMKLYEKLGFVKEGIQRKHRFKNGSFKDKAAFGMLRSEWLDMPWAEKEINLEVGVEK